MKTSAPEFLTIQSKDISFSNFLWHILSILNIGETCFGYDMKIIFYTQLKIVFTMVNNLNFFYLRHTEEWVILTKTNNSVLLNFLKCVLLLLIFKQTTRKVIRRVSRKLNENNLIISCNLFVLVWFIQYALFDRLPLCISTKSRASHWNVVINYFDKF